MPRKIPIIVDDREVQSGIVDELNRWEGISADVRRLPLGDFDVDGKFLFERKTLADLVASIKDGRLFSQACRLVNTERMAVMILEGTSRDLAASGMRREAIQGALVNLSLFLGIPLLRSMDTRESARLMVFAARQGRANVSGALPRQGRRLKGRRRTQTHILQGLPGVGPRRAVLLLQRFGGVEAVMRAGVDELSSVDGIGATTAERIRWAVREAGETYQADVGPGDIPI